MPAKKKHQMQRLLNDTKIFMKFFAESSNLIHLYKGTRNG